MRFECSMWSIQLNVCLDAVYARSGCEESKNEMNPNLPVCRGPCSPEQGTAPAFWESAREERAFLRSRP